MPTLICVTVKDALTNRPLPGAVVYIKDYVYYTYFTDTNGFFTSDNLVWGTYNIQINKEGYMPLPDTTIQAIRDKTTHYEFYLSPANVTAAANLYTRTSDGSWRPLAANDQGEIITSGTWEKTALMGTYFTASTNAVTLPINHYIALLLTNPLGSQRLVRLGQLLGGAGGMNNANTTFHLFKNADISPAFYPEPISISPENTNFGLPNTSVCTVRYVTGANNPQAGGSLLYTCFPSSGIEVDLAGRIILQPGNKLLISLRAPQQNTLAAIGIGWREELL